MTLLGSLSLALALAGAPRLALIFLPESSSLPLLALSLDEEGKAATLAWAFVDPQAPTRPLPAGVLRATRPAPVLLEGDHVPPGASLQEASGLLSVRIADAGDWLPLAPPAPGPAAARLPVLDPRALRVVVHANVPAAFAPATLFGRDVSVSGHAWVSRSSVGTVVLPRGNAEPPRAVWEGLQPAGACRGLVPSTFVTRAAAPAAPLLAPAAGEVRCVGSLAVVPVLAPPRLAPGGSPAGAFAITEVLPLSASP